MSWVHPGNAPLLRFIPLPCFGWGLLSSLSLLWVRPGGSDAERQRRGWRRLLSMRRTSPIAPCPLRSTDAQALTQPLLAGAAHHRLAGR